MKNPEENALLSESDVRAIVNLLGKVCALPGGRSERRCCLMQGLCELVDAEFWLWGISVSLSPDALPTWYIQNHGGFDDTRLSKFFRAQEHPDMTRLTAPFVQALVEKKTHLTRMRQQTDPEDNFRRSDAYALWLEADVSPGILSCRPLDEKTISAVSVYRRMNKPLFTARESRIMHILLTEISWLHQPGEAEDSDTLEHRLAPRLHTIFNLLTLGLNRRQIADNLGISVHTLNGYVKEIYRHFSVHSQAELIARFRSGDGGDNL